MDKKELHSKIVDIIRNYYDQETTAANKILDLFSVSESTLTVPDIRNKLTPIVNLIALLQCDEMVDDYIPKEIEQCKISINYLAKRDVYSR